MRSVLLIAALIVVALLLRWAGSGWFMDGLASLHGR
jgi:hypothetical protein